MSDLEKIAKKLSDPMRTVLRNLSAGGGAADHCRTMSDYGGLQSVLRALAVRGLMDWEWELTPLGKQVADLISRR